MIVVGLTGGIGSGKSTVSAALARLGAVIIDADALARELQRPGAPVFLAIVDRFGAGVVAPDGTLDRPALASVVFPDPELLAELNSLTHPAIGREIRSRLRSHRGTEDVVVLDVALLIENNRYPVAAVVVVDVPVDTAVERLVRDRGMDERDVMARIARQASREQRLSRADYVIDNSGTVEQLLQRIPELWAWIRSLEPLCDDDPRLAAATDTPAIDGYLG